MSLQGGGRGRKGHFRINAADKLSCGGKKKERNKEKGMKNHPGVTLQENKADTEYLPQDDQADVPEHWLLSAGRGNQASGQQLGGRGRENTPGEMEEKN